MSKLTVTTLGLLTVLAVAAPAFGAEMKGGMMKEGDMMMIAPDGHITMQHPAKTSEMSTLMMKVNVDGQPMTNPIIMMMHHGKVLMMKDEMMSNGKMMSDMMMHRGK